MKGIGTGLAVALEFEEELEAEVGGSRVSCVWWWDGGRCV